MAISTMVAVNGAVRECERACKRQVIDYAKRRMTKTLVEACLALETGEPDLPTAQHHLGKLLNLIERL